MWDKVEDWYWDWEGYWADFFLPFDVELAEEGELDAETSTISEVTGLVLAAAILIVAGGLLAWYTGIAGWLKRKFK